ncbi:MAG: S8/S53 family peptidase [Candidatus Eremiobacteraeota bacterium]|nr:S8/S53 family peptidase [Candidatus Eremiobacteraeota bacterium]MBV8499078.1 S8/S53 family peptidase [Candidatus Eremiobacteraeota bacterium]
MTHRQIIPGSERSPLPGSQVLGDADPTQEATVTVFLRSKRAGVPAPGTLSRVEFADRYGADPADVASVEAFARAHGLAVVESSSGRRSVVLRGTVARLSAAFGVTLKRCQADGVMYRGREGGITVPADIAGAVVAVLGLDDRPQAAARVRIAAKPIASFTPSQVAELYDFPSGVDGTGQSIGIVELGGGFSQADFASYLSGLGITAQTVTIVTIDGAGSAPGQDQNADVEVMLDAEVAGSVAPGARIAMYFAPNSDQGFLDAVTTAIHDTTNKPTVISISWGAAESSWTAQARDALNQAIAAAQAMAISVCVASGDGGSSDGQTDGASHADFPASSPYVLGCGGTTLSGSGATIASETTWSDSGGGVSDYFSLPSWQSKANVPAPPAGFSGGGRGVPDVSGDADPNTGYQILVDGSSMVAGGTSAVAPLWAALIALMNQQRGKNAGFLNASLYAVPGYPNNPGPLHDITTGSNGAYDAGPGWDPCTGLGSPDGTRLSKALP